MLPSEATAAPSTSHNSQWPRAESSHRTRRIACSPVPPLADGEDGRKSQRLSSRKRTRAGSCESEAAASASRAPPTQQSPRLPDGEGGSSESEDGATPTKPHDGTRLLQGEQRAQRSRDSCPLPTPGVPPVEAGLKEGGAEPARLGPSLPTSHPVVDFLASADLQGFAAHVVLRQGIVTFEQLQQRVTGEDSAAELLGACASRKHTSELWKGLLRRQREWAREEKRLDAEERRRAFAEAREARRQAKREQWRRRRRGEAREQGRPITAAVAFDSPRPVQLRLEDCAAAAPPPELCGRAKPVSSSTTRAAERLGEARQRVAQQSQQDASAEEKERASVDWELCPASQLFDRLFAESDALHARGRDEMAKQLRTVQDDEGCTTVSRPLRKDAAVTPTDGAEFFAALAYRDSKEPLAVSAHVCALSSGSPSASSSRSLPLSAAMELAVREAVAGHRHHFGRAAQLSQLSDRNAPAIDVDDAGGIDSGVAESASLSPRSPSPMEEEEALEADMLVLERVCGRGISYWSAGGVVVSPSLLSAPPPSPELRGVQSTATDQSGLLPVEEEEKDTAPNASTISLVEDANSTPPVAGALSASTAEAYAVTDSSAVLVSEAAPEAEPTQSPEPASSHLGAADAMDELTKAIEDHLRRYNNLVGANRTTGNERARPKLRAILVPIHHVQDSSEDKCDADNVQLVCVRPTWDTATAPSARLRWHADTQLEDEEATVVLPTPELSQLHHHREQEGRDEESSSNSSIAVPVTANACGRRSTGLCFTQHSLATEAASGARCAPTQISSGDSDCVVTQQQGEDSAFIPSQLSATLAHPSQNGGQAAHSVPSTTRALSFTPESARSHSSHRHRLTEQREHGAADANVEPEDAWWESLGLDALVTAAATATGTTRASHSPPHDPFISLKESRAPPAERHEEEDRRASIMAKDAVDVVDVEEDDGENGAEDATLIPQPPQEERRPSGDAEAGREEPEMHRSEPSALATLVQMYLKSSALESASFEALRNLCLALKLPVEQMDGLAPACERANAFTRNERHQIQKEAMADALRQLAVRTLFVYQVAPAVLHRAESISGLPYTRVKAAELIARGRLLTADDLDQARRNAKAEENDEVSRCILAALTADTAERIEAIAAASDEPCTAPDEAGPCGQSLTPWERALLMEPVDADAAALVVQREFPFVSSARVHKLLEENGISLEVVRYGCASPSPSPSLTGPPSQQPLQGQAVGDASFSPRSGGSLDVLNEQQRTTQELESESTGCESGSASPSRSRSRSPQPQGPSPGSAAPRNARKRENTRRFFASQGFRTRGGLWRGRGGRGGRGPGM